MIGAGKEAWRVWIEIGDDEPGVTEDGLILIAARGVRLDRKAAGHGPGLAIAADIAEAAQGALYLRNGAPGFVATFDLPKARAVADTKS